MDNAPALIIAGTLEPISKLILKDIGLSRCHQKEREVSYLTEMRELASQLQVPALIRNFVCDFEIGSN
jgi:hypothetical protein